MSLCRSLVLCPADANCLLPGCHPCLCHVRWPLGSARALLRGLCLKNSLWAVSWSITWLPFPQVALACDAWWSMSENHCINFVQLGFPGGKSLSFTVTGNDTLAASFLGLQFFPFGVLWYFPVFLVTPSVAEKKSDVSSFFLLYVTCSKCQELCNIFLFCPWNSEFFKTRISLFWSIQPGTY